MLLAADLAEADPTPARDVRAARQGDDRRRDRAPCADRARRHAAMPRRRATRSASCRRRSSRQPFGDGADGLHAARSTRRDRGHDRGRADRCVRRSRATRASSKTTCGDGSALPPACRGSRQRRPTCSCRRRRTGISSAASISRRAAIRARKSSRACNISAVSRSGFSRSMPTSSTWRPQRAFIRARSASRHAEPSSTRRRSPAGERRCSRSCNSRPPLPTTSRSARPGGPRLTRRPLPYEVPARADAADPFELGRCASPSSHSTRIRATPWCSPRTATSSMRAPRGLRTGGTTRAARRSSPVATSCRAARGSACRATAAGHSSPTCASPARFDPRAPSRGSLVPALLRDARPLGRRARSDRRRRAGLQRVQSRRGRCRDCRLRLQSRPARAGARDAASTAFPTPASTRRGRSSSARKAGLAAWVASGDDELDRLWPVLIDRTPADDRRAARTPGFRASASVCSRRRSS